MGLQCASWVHSSRRSYANSNDCHVPHNNVLNEYYFKGKDGMRHAIMGTLHLEFHARFVAVTMKKYFVIRFMIVSGKCFLKKCIR
jgi:hypothetical protein